MGLKKQQRPVGPVVLGHPLPTFNPLLDKMFKNAGDDFKFPGNTIRDEKGNKVNNDTE